MDILLTALRAAAEPTRLRILAILAENELTVSEFTQILGQSQPRVSRHLKVMCDAGLLERFREGAWAFYRLTDAGRGAQVAHALLPLIPADDPALTRDLRRVEAVRHEREEGAARYFREVAPYWHHIRSLYVPESAVERAMVEALGDAPIGEMLDLGTGTGRILEVLAPRIRRGVGFDLSHAMLAVARARLAKAKIHHCHVRYGDLYNLPLADDSVDVVTIHQVLHFLEDPRSGISEAARVLRPRGRLLVVDFAPHDLEFLRTEHAHRRLGISDEAVSGWCRAAGLDVSPVVHLAGEPGAGQTLTVSLWLAVKRARARSRVQKVKS
ncbi:MAG: metalloregulator ArsR/SmtB family transcription factor [Gammaproteobacteria bacterium]|nr:metalloregulator ArsR/SmtB family transcription factor [Gammaproteobacteria bacterium]NIR82002.1 metalloregulator ArsR/SmtB family transcription factor [Gammaproteobacteria bacterium]NIR89062.1 metalloregulator ArsR/SmtB family transcription factor [Gammaproteobacteria bacterium]NIU03109.1 metalloregulator ArsR/SmtB family transcription factor [Gammaproteobacteria bacterium]NIX84384.1 metalloregulator ArsR/SmtB family transcription factor [Gammaproteobacteria bacterium]